MGGILGFDVLAGTADMAAHQQLRHLTIAGFNGLHDTAMFVKGFLRTVGHRAELITVHAHQVVKLANQHLAEGAIVAALDDAVMEIQVAFPLKVSGILLQILLLLLQVLLVLQQVLLQVLLQMLLRVATIGSRKPRVSRGRKLLMQMLLL